MIFKSNNIFVCIFLVLNRFKNYYIQTQKVCNIFKYISEGIRFSNRTTLFCCNRFHPNEFDKKSKILIYVCQKQMKTIEKLHKVNNGGNINKINRLVFKIRNWKTVDKINRSLLQLNCKFLDHQHKSFNNKEDEMQLNRRLVMNLTKSTKFLLPATLTSAYNPQERKTAAILQNYYSTSIKPRPKQNLLRFPVVQLEETLAKFLKSVEPLLDQSEFQQTEEETQKFLRTDGAKLQELLQQVAEREENWLADRWLRTAYMQYRDPVTVYSSPGMAFPRQAPFDSINDFLNYAAKAIFVLVKYKEIIDKGEIPVVKMGENELDNSQFEKVFGTCRVPQLIEDCLMFNPESKHVTAIFKNHFYKVPVYAKNGQPLHPEIIVSQLKCIINSERWKGPAFGILSADNRDNWASSYSELINIPGNEELVSEIQKSLFTVSLDEEVPIEEGVHDMNVQAAQLIHGGGSQENSGNRWMDKTIQVIINPNGLSGFCYEHSPAEGQPIALMTDYIVKNLEGDDILKDAATGDFHTATKLPLQSSPALDKQIDIAKGIVNKLAYDLHLNVGSFKNYGKAFLKHQKMSPDSFIQMALQYAFYRLHRMPGAGYESAHLRIYNGGRTETIRSCSNESIDFAKAMCDANSSDEERVELMRKAVNGHRIYTNEALRGRGVDRHLLGLKLMALENKLPIPAFYKTPGFIKSSHFRLSTSQVASVNEAFMCYGPLVHNGYACCYNPRENDMILSIASWRSNTDTDADRFAASMIDALDSMSASLCRAGQKVAAKL